MKVTGDVLEQCPICGSREISRLFVYEQTAQYRILADQCVFESGCERCGVVFQNPIPDDAALERYYASRDGWEVDHGDHDLEERYAKVARKLSDFLTRNGDGKGRRVFDFGCGFGTFLDALKAEEFETWGLEPGLEANRTLSLRHRMVTDIPGDVSFDLVVISHVLEHLRDPMSVLGRLVASVRPGGCLYVAVPDLGRLPLHRNVGNVFNGSHLYAFTPGSLGFMMGSAGLSRITPLISDDWDQADRRVNEAGMLRLRMAGFRDVDQRGHVPLPGLGAARLAIRRFYESEGHIGRMRIGLPVSVQAGLIRARRVFGGS